MIKYYAYYYPSWHYDEKRCANFSSEWEIVESAKGGFNNHVQPRKPVLGYLNLSNIKDISLQIRVARYYGISGFLINFYWDNGSIILDKPLYNIMDVINQYDDFEFGIMWVNRRPHNKLPISINDSSKDNEEPTFKDRIVYTSKSDLQQLIEFCSKNIFTHKNYLKIRGKPYFSIFSVNEVIRDLGDETTTVLNGIKYIPKSYGLSELFLTGIAHGIENWIHMATHYHFDKLTSYVLLPDWMGAFKQYYLERVNKCAKIWDIINKSSGGIYFPSITVGWDSTPRGYEVANGLIKKYPWYPVITDDCPTSFAIAIEEAIKFCRKNLEEPHLIHSPA